MKVALILLVCIAAASAQYAGYFGGVQSLYGSAYNPAALGLNPFGSYYGSYYNLFNAYNPYLGNPLYNPVYGARSVYGNPAYGFPALYRK